VQFSICHVETRSIGKQLQYSALTYRAPDGRNVTHRYIAND